MKSLSKDRVIKSIPADEKCRLCKRWPGLCPKHNFYEWSNLPLDPTPMTVISPYRISSGRVIS